MKRRIITTALHVTLLLAALAVSILAIAPSAAAQGSATITVLLRGCPEGVDPQTSADPAAECTIPLDAPDDAGVFWGGDGQGGMPLVDTERQTNGAYMVSIPANQDVELFNFEPTVYDTFTVIGADTFMNGTATVNLAEGESRNLVYYYQHLPEGTATLNIILRGCPEGLEPESVTDPATECTIPLDAPDAAGALWGGDGQGGMPVADAERLHNGTYTMLAPAGTSIELVGFEPTVYEGYVMLGTDGMIDGDARVMLAPDETRTVEVYYYR